MHDIPERAVRCFESWSGLSVAFYDQSKCFSDCFARNRHYHYQKLCESVKCSGREKECKTLDQEIIKNKSWSFRNGGFKICHAGVLELLVSVYSNDMLLSTMTAGILRPPRRLPEGIPVLYSDSIRVATDLSELRKLGENELDTMLEGFRQLAARLQCWFEADSGGSFMNRYTPRAAVIQYIVQRRGRENLTLGHLARYLNLSRSRAAHAIREATGKTLKELITEQRLERARTLLEHSNRSIAEIAASSGYADLANFHRQFKRHLGITPNEYRRRVRSGQKAT